MPLTPLSSEKATLSLRMDYKDGCELAQKYNHAHRVGKHCLFGVLMLLLKGRLKQDCFL